MLPPGIIKWGSKNKTAPTFLKIGAFSVLGNSPIIIPWNRFLNNSQEVKRTRVFALFGDSTIIIPWFRQLSVLPPGGFIATASPALNITVDSPVISLIFQAEPTLTVLGITVEAATFTATAEPTLIIGTGISFIATADPRMSIDMQVLPGFIATANPQLSIFTVDSQQQSCLVSDPLSRSVKPINYVY